MAFKVNCNQPEPDHTFEDDDKFEFKDGGVLKVSRANKTNLYLSPTVWRSIEEAPPPFKGLHPWPADIEAVAEEGPF
jgi:hypothetical protein